MVEYIEDIIFLNILTNFLILILAQRFVCQKVNFLKTFCVSIIGVFSSVINIFLTISTLYLVVVNIILQLIMSCILVEKYYSKTFLLFSFVVIFSNFLLNGLFSFAEIFCQGTLLNLAKTFLCVCSFSLLSSIIKQFYKKKKLVSFYYNLTLQNGENKYDIKAYLDSGNLLQDDETGLSILLLNFETFNKLFGKSATVVDYLQSRLDKKIDGKYITFSTVGSKSKMFVCHIEKVLKNENNKREELHLLVGLSNNFYDKDYEALLSPLAL
ncbi:MAG: hypothetical protein EOM55_03105 [Clostridia bacterium]|nr:hypothetical protein [Clostridia bacterium]